MARVELTASLGLVVHHLVHEPLLPHHAPPLLLVGEEGAVVHVAVAVVVHPEAPFPVHPLPLWTSGKNVKMRRGGSDEAWGRYIILPSLMYPHC